MACFGVLEVLQILRMYVLADIGESRVLVRRKDSKYLATTVIESVLVVLTHLYISRNCAMAQTPTDLLDSIPPSRTEQIHLRARSYHTAYLQGR